MNETHNNAFCGGHPEFYPHNDHRYNQTKEDISISYLGSMCAYLGLIMDRRSSGQDRDSIDVSVKSYKRNDPGIVESRPCLDFQMKSTSMPEYDRDKKVLKYELGIKNYRDLNADSVRPPLLAVHVLPPDVSRWVSVADDHLAITERMLWFNVYGSSPSTNPGRKTVTLSIPLKNALTTQSLKRLLDMVAHGETISNDLH